MRAAVPGWVGACALAAALALAAGPGGLAGQAFAGRVMEQGNVRPIAPALVRANNAQGEQIAFMLTDSLGRYRLEMPEPGAYTLVAERLGYVAFKSHLLEVGNPEGVYPIDLMMAVDPIPLGGIDVTASRLAEIELGVRHQIGMDPRSLRVTPVFRRALIEHVEKGHNLADMLRWMNLPAITTKETTDGPCFQWRNRHCLPVYLNGQRIPVEFVDVLPLDLPETVVIVMPNESILYEAGAVLLLTEAWIR